MENGRYAALARLLLVLAVVAGLMLTACSEAQVGDGAHVQHLLSAEADEHAAINILGVDFDPPLDYLTTLQDQSVTLLVALENRGRAPVRDVRIAARLYLGRGNDRVIARDGLVQEVPPGQVIVYRFPRLHALPLRRTYTLEVRVLTADGHRLLNRRTYTVTLQGDDHPQPMRLRAPGR